MESLASLSSFKHQCFLIDYAAWVTEPSSVEQLYLMGFGKGTLSRSRPLYGKSLRTGMRDLDAPDRVQGPAQKPLPEGTVEPLQLMLEEVYFLARAGLLIVHTSVPTVGFQFQFKAYDFYRQRGWMPKSGLKFGADLVLYYQSAELYHSKYAVQIELRDEEGNEWQSQEERGMKNKSWVDLLASNRVAAQAKKQTLRCSIIIPAHIDFTSPTCLELMTIKEVVFARWKT